MSTQAAAQLELDTIVAIATPPGRGGVGIVRLSGPAALAIARRIVRLRGVPVARQAHYGFVRDAQGQRLDDALLTWFAAPASYTGEDVVEIGTHGAPVVLQAVVEAALQHGARLARPGEFTERAYFAGKLDLTAAEAVRDLIEAQTVGQARLAAQQVGGALAREVAPIKRGLLELIAMLEAGIDFAEDDLDTLPADALHVRMEALLVPLQRLEGSFAHGRLLRDGLKLAIVGKPNAGKSSLFNRLLGRDRAIVTPIAGTTRDVVSEPLLLGGAPIQLLDTAGLRETEDAVERIGIARSREVMADADLVLHLVDAGEFAANPLVLTALPMGDPIAAPVLQVLTKADLLAAPARADLLQALEGVAAVVLTSAVTGEGMPSLQAAILRSSAVDDRTSSGAALINLRQHGAVATAVLALDRVQRALDHVTPHELLLLDLYEAMAHLDELTGTTANDDVLALIFSTFCIGK